MILLTALLSAIIFALGLGLASGVAPGVELRGAGPGARAAVVTGVASALVGKLLAIVVTLVFLPIVLLGPIGAALIQAAANVVVLYCATLFGDTLKIEPRRTIVVLAVVLAVLQVLAQRLL